jgi:hypothetical protein
VHITVPATYRVEPISGVIIHHSRAFGQTMHPVLSPPRTSVEDTVLDLTQGCASFDDAFNWLCRAVGRGLTTPERLRAAAGERSRLRWRPDLMIAVGDIAVGVRSPLERGYVNKVERAHGLPEAERQARIVIGGQTRYIDNLYRRALLAVELDGRVAHPPEQRWADSHRDNAHAALGILTLRYNWPDVDSRPCAAAVEVAGLLTVRGTAVQLRRCGPACSITGDVVTRIAG